jgi:autotransporter-associated beta strand protein
MRRRLSAAAICSAVVSLAARQAFGQQAVVSQIAAMPYLPVNYQYQNWTSVAQGFDSTVFNPVAQEGYQYKSFWFQNDSENGISQGFGMPSYIGQTQASEGNGEAITQIAAVLGASLAGIDKQSQTLSDGNTYDFVQMASRFYDSGTGANLVLNNIGSQGSGSFWYDQLPQILFDGLISQYYSSYATGSAGQQRLDMIMNTGAAKMHSVIDVLAGNSTTAPPNFNYQGFNYVSMAPVTGGHTEPDGAAGAAYEQYAAYIHTGVATDLTDAERCVQTLQNTAVNQNPLYETVLPFGALTAARLNAEQGTNYDVAKIVNWCFSPTSVVRSGWGAISAAQWNGYGAAGLIGSTTDQGGYGFSMNSYLYPAALVPLVRYDDRFGNAIGQWMLNLTNSSRMFLKSGLPASNQTNASWSDAPSDYYSYEGVKESSGGVSPLAGGDATSYNSSWLNFAYGSGDVGVLGGIVSPTNVPMILQLNLLATDFFHAPADPSFLFYNPYNTQKSVQINVGSTAVNVYDAISGKVLATNVSGLTSIAIPAQSSRSLVYTPTNDSLVDNAVNVSVNGVIVNYRSPELNRLYWDLNGSAAGAGGSTLAGTWDSTAANWNPASAGTGTTSAWAAGRVAMFAAGTDGGGAYTVSVSGTQTIGGLYFQTGNVTLQGGSFNLASDSTFTAASGVHTINTPISGSFAFIKDGPGTVVLGAINTYTGITTIEQGVLQLGNAFALQSTNVDVDVNNGLDINSLNASLGGLSGSGSVNISNQTLTVDNDNQPAEFAGVLSGTGQVIKAGAGVWTLDGPNTFAGGILLRGGETSVAMDSSLGATGGALNFDGGTLQVTGTAYTSTSRIITMTANGAGFDIAGANNTFTIAEDLSGGALSKYGLGTLVLSGTNSQSGLILYSGTLYAAARSNLGSGPVTFAGASTLTLANTAALTFPAGVTVNSASTLNVSGMGVATISGPLAMNAGLVQTGGGTLKITSLPSGSGSITLRAGTLLADMNSNWAIGGTTGAGGIYIADASSNNSDNQTVLLGAGVTMSYGRLYFQPYALSGTKTLGTDSTSGVATINTYIQLQSSSINLQLTAAPGGQFNLPLGILGSTAANITILGGGTISLGGIGAAQSEYYQGVTTVENGTLLLIGNDIAGNARDTYVLGNSSYLQAVQIGDANTPASAQLSFLTGAAATINHNINVNNFGGSIFVGGASANTSTFNSAISLARDVYLASVAGGVTNFTGIISGVGGITTNGPGSIHLSGANTYQGSTTINAGTLTLDAAGSLASLNITVAPNAVLNANGNLASTATLNANGTVSFGAGSSGILTRQLAALNIASTGLVLVGASSHANRTVLITPMLSFAGTSNARAGKLDLANNDMVIPKGGETALANLTNQIEQGFNLSGSIWNGSAGIVSSSASTDPNHLTTIGVLLNSAGAYGTPSAPLGMFDGYAPTTADVLAKYTYFGDANLDGKVDGTDYSRIDAGYSSGGSMTGWVNGDFNYDGTIDGSDYTLIDNAFNQQGGQLSSAALIAAETSEVATSVSAVPEPTTLVLLGTGAIGLLSRHRRREPQ